MLIDGRLRASAPPTRSTVCVQRHRHSWAPGPGSRLGALHAVRPGTQSPAHARRPRCGPPPPGACSHTHRPAPASIEPRGEVRGGNSSEDRASTTMHHRQGTAADATQAAAHAPGWIRASQSSAHRRTGAWRSACGARRKRRRLGRQSGTRRVPMPYRLSRSQLYNHHTSASIIIQARRISIEFESISAPEHRDLPLAAPQHTARASTAPCRPPAGAARVARGLPASRALRGLYASPSAVV
jgi:hypothetical protein